MRYFHISGINLSLQPNRQDSKIDISFLKLNTQLKLLETYSWIASRVYSSWITCNSTNYFLISIFKNIFPTIHNRTSPAKTENSQIKVLRCFSVFSRLVLSFCSSASFFAIASDWLASYLLNDVCNVVYRSCPACN